VSATLGASGFPLSPEQLPPDTEGLRQHRLLADVADGLRLPSGSLPPEALWSYAAGFCGVQDVFFELLSDMPLTASELAAEKEMLKQGLACGRRLVPRIEAGLSRFEVDYRVDGNPILFGLFPTEVDKPLEGSRFAALSPTPRGVFAAVCRDDHGGGPRGSCRDGERARLLLELNGGLLGAHGVEAPSLLKTFAERREADATSAELHELFSELASADDVMVERGRHCAATLTRSLTGLSVLPNGHVELAATLGKHAAVCASARSGGHGKADWTFVYRARDEAGVADIEQAIRRRGAQLKVEPPFPERFSEDERKHAEALHAARRRALLNAEIAVSGKELRVTWKVMASPTERADMAAFDTQRKARAEAAARIVRALADGDEPSEADLKVAAATSD